VRSRLEYAAKAFLVTSFVGVMTAGVLRLQQKALADDTYHVDLGAWSVVEKPSWATTDDVRALRDTTRLRGWHASILNPDAGPVVWRSIELAPQVVRVAGMRRCLPDQYEAVVELRKPSAAVQVGAGPRSKAPAWVEIDADGVALSEPVAARPVRDGKPLRVICGASGGAVAPGRPFGADVVEAADLAAELDRFGTDADRVLLAALDEIDVSNFGGRLKPEQPEVVLRRTGFVPGAAPPAKPSRRCTVEWGRARASDPYDPEPLFGAKAARLVQVLRMFPALDGLATVKVAFDDLVVVPSTGSPLTGSALGGLPTKK
jgi:hypothetical protein